ncbi:MAG: tRNA (adenosine(37)-N6)-dimethylallyltransferase MiaA [Pseudomonadota bacterium]
MSGHVVYIAGPTAAGKTQAALGLAEGLIKRGRPTNIINADAMQVYRDAPILTGLPTDEEQKIAPHYLFGIADGADRYSVGRWLGEALAIIEETLKNDGVAVVVGGTGLYFRALDGGLDPIPDISPSIMRRARERLEELGLWAFREEVLEKDPKMVRLDPSDSQRHLRAWSVFEYTGTPLSSYHQASQGRHPSRQQDDGETVDDTRASTANLPSFNVTARIVIEPEREFLYRKAETRFDSMLDCGALAEARRLAERDLSQDLPIMKALGVAELTAHLHGEMLFDEACERAKRNTRRFIKRQLTWFRNQTPDWPRVADPSSAIHAVGTLIERTED